MLRVKDPAVALGFYTGVMGMRLLRKLDFPEMKFSLYFLAPPGGRRRGARGRGPSAPSGPSRSAASWSSPTTGAPSPQEDFRYHDGNAQPQGFGHICFAVPDLEAAVRLVRPEPGDFVKRPDQGKMKDVAFIKDPDGYWIEIVQPSRLGNLGR